MRLFSVQSDDTNRLKGCVECDYTKNYWNHDCHTYVLTYDSHFYQTKN
jgi:hypothetical protein